MFCIEFGCSNGEVYFTKVRSDNFDYILKELRKFIKCIDWTTVEDIMIRKEDE